MARKITATVETLTAEVRVLVVGSRQVTLSVYNQLDMIDFEKIEAFGRVHPKDSADWEIWVVGRDPEGVLCGSWLPYLGEGAISDMPHLQYPEYIVSKGDDYLRLSRQGGPSGAIRVPQGFRGREAEAKDMACLWNELPLIVLAGLR